MNYLLMLSVMLFLLIKKTHENSSASPIWVASTFFKAGMPIFIQGL